MSLKEYLPTWYEGINDFDILIKVEDGLLAEIVSEITKVKDNQWIQTADEMTILLYEKLLNILANPTTESLTFRKQRILNRLQSSPPFTMIYLRSQLDKIFGADNYSIHLDYDNYTLYVESSTDSANWFYEAQLTIQRVKPANILYIQVPVRFEPIQIKEWVTISKANYFRIGRSRVGREPLFYMSDESKVIIQ